MVVMNVDGWLPTPQDARGTHLLDYLETLLRRCEDLADGRDWAQVAVDGRDAVDAIRAAAAASAPGIGVFDFAAETVHDHLTATLEPFDGVDPLVAVVACARAVDDIWGDDLTAEWPSFVGSGTSCPQLLPSLITAAPVRTAVRISTITASP